MVCLIHCHGLLLRVFKHFLGLRVEQVRVQFLLEAPKPARRARGRSAHARGSPCCITTRCCYVADGAWLGGDDGQYGGRASSGGYLWSSASFSMANDALSKPNTWNAVGADLPLVHARSEQPVPPPDCANFLARHMYFIISDPQDRVFVLSEPNRTGSLVIVILEVGGPAKISSTLGRIWRQLID